MKLVPKMKAKKSAHQRMPAKLGTSSSLCKVFPLSHHLARARNQLKLAILTLWAILAGVSCAASRTETTERKGRIFDALEDYHGFGRDFEGSFSRKTPSPAVRQS